jgi:DNA-binding NarL/FixJ family response regulator
MTKIAIIEDNITTRDMLVELINSQPDCRCVCECSSSKEALIEVPKQQPAVALVDICLPDESGIACAAQLSEKMPALQIIMVTAYQDTDPLFQALKTGPCGNILNPSRPREIIQAIAEARPGGPPMTGRIARMAARPFRAPSAAPGPDGLTARESEILMLLAEGLSNKEIAHRANISPGTVRIHLGNIFKKLRVRSRTEAAVKYITEADLIASAEQAFLAYDKEEQERAQRQAR